MYYQQFKTTLNEYELRSGWGQGLYFFSVIFDKRWLSAQFSSLSQLDLSRTEFWITCKYSVQCFFFHLNLNMAFKF